MRGEKAGAQLLSFVAPAAAGLSCREPPGLDLAVCLLLAACWRLPPVAGCFVDGDAAFLLVAAGLAFAGLAFAVLPLRPEAAFFARAEGLATCVFRPLRPLCTSSSRCPTVRVCKHAINVRRRGCSRSPHAARVSGAGATPDKPAEGSDPHEDSEYLGNAALEDVVAEAQRSPGADREGHRVGVVPMVKDYERLAVTQSALTRRGGTPRE